ncbi:MAG: hypothetical protein ACK5RL_17440 [Acidimicrobiales bacterium]
MTELVLIDIAGRFADVLDHRLLHRDHHSMRLTAPDQALHEARRSHPQPPDVVVVDPEAMTGDVSGLDGAVWFRRWCPESALVFLVRTDPAGCPSPVVRVAWETLRPWGAVARSSPAIVVEAVHRVLRGPEVTVDPVLRPWLGSRDALRPGRPPLERLVQHGGHVKVWRALLRFDEPPSYRQVALLTGLSVNTIRSYRQDLLGPLAAVGLSRPSMGDLFTFARGVRPLLLDVLRRGPRPRDTRTREAVTNATPRETPRATGPTLTGFEPERRPGVV